MHRARPRARHQAFRRCTDVDGSVADVSDAVAIEVGESEFAVISTGLRVARQAAKASASRARATFRASPHHTRLWNMPSRACTR
ncbi:MAG: hypothetical protein JWM77_3900 [Rhodospirillales bacterium]|nr:hypothetical protein [Rhodospirillales bacterium]